MCLLFFEFYIRVIFTFMHMKETKCISICRYRPLLYDLLREHLNKVK